MYLFSQVKEWLCLTCQMQRALTASESIHPPPMKAQASPSKVSTPNVAKAEDIGSGQKADVSDKKRLENQPAGVPHGKEEPKLSTKDKSSSVPVQKKEDETGLPPQKDTQNTRITSETDTTTVGSDLTKPPPPQAPSVNTEVKTVHPKEKDVTVPGVAAIKTVTDKKRAETETKEATETPGSGTLTPSSSPKTPRAASKTTEAVTGKMFGFGSSLFSSASTLITSAVQESRTPPTSRKMSAPAQVSDKMATSVQSPKVGPNVSPQMTLTKETKPVEKRQDSSQQVKSSPSDQDSTVDRTSTKPVKTDESHAAPQVGKSTCPLCKGDLNIGSGDPPNYNSCTECKSDVCNKCGFSPMPSAKEVMQQQVISSFLFVFLLCF